MGCTSRTVISCCLLSIILRFGWFCSSLNVPLFPSSAVAAVLATTWFVEDEISPLCTMACSGLLSVRPLCWVSLLWLISGAVPMLSLSPPSLPPSSSSCSCSVRFSFSRRTLNSPLFILLRIGAFQFQNSLSRQMLPNTDVFLFSSLLFYLSSAASQSPQGSIYKASKAFLSFNLLMLFFLPLPSSPPHPRSYCTSCPSSLRKTTSISCSNISAARRAWTKKDRTHRPPSGTARAASGSLEVYCPLYSE